MCRSDTLKRNGSVLQGAPLNWTRSSAVLQMLGGTWKRWILRAHTNTLHAELSGGGVTVSCDSFQCTTV